MAFKRLRARYIEMIFFYEFQAKNSLVGEKITKLVVSLYFSFAIILTKLLYTLILCINN